MLRAIIVDDEELSIRRLKRILTESGEIEQCHAFLSPLEAYEFAMAHPVDIAFLDISMPSIHGMHLAGLLRGMHARLPIVFVTGYDEYAVQAFEADALDYLMKPVSAERVGMTLDKLRRLRPAGTAATEIEIRLFNGLRMFRRGSGRETLKLRSPKTEELFALLVCRRSASRAEIADTLWGSLEPEKAWKNLNSTLYYIRSAIGPEQAGKVLRTDKNEIRLEENAVYCDLYEFERLLGQMRQEPAPRAEQFRQAEALYAGELLKGKGYEWAGSYSRRLERSYIGLLEAAARFHRELGERQQALRYMENILEHDQLREDIHDEMIRLYVELGRRNEALRQYRQLEDMLLREFGTEPDPRIKEAIADMM